MTRNEGMKLMSETVSELVKCYEKLDKLNTAVTHPVAQEVQAKAEEIIKASVSVSCMALNLMELPQEAKKPFAALLYAIADSVSTD